MNQTGDISELAVSLEAAKRGISVFLPFGHNQKVDLIFLIDGKPVTVQVKKAVKSGKGKGSYRARLHSSGPTKSKATGKRYRYYKPGDFDILAVHVVEENVIALYRLDEIAAHSITWRRETGVRDNWDLVLS